MEEREIIQVLVVALVILGLGIAGVATALSIKGDRESVITGVPDRMMKALVKGSIYETGEYMSVFGTCMDSYDVPVLNSTALFTSYYPNGTLWFSNASMQKISSGYFVWQGNMDTVGGTYFTEMTCFGLNQTAKAFGEWQNPVWVNRVAAIFNNTNYTNMLIMDMNGTIVGINGTVNEINDIVNALNVSISNVTNIINADFNYTNSLINSTANTTWKNINFLNKTMVNNFNATNVLINDAANIANHSVDRNDSYLAWLMMRLINGTSTPMNGNVSWAAYSVDRIIYMHNWNIKVRAYDEYGRDIESPYVACTITTNLGGTEYMEAHGDHFEADVFIYTYGPFTWSVNCFRT